MTPEQLLQIMPYARRTKAVFFAPLLNDCFVEFSINTPARQAAFLAQIGHESGQLRYLEELASGAAYEGREDLGNTEPGDGIAFKGRGLVQITGRLNYAACGRALGVDLIREPERLSTAALAVRSAGWFWRSHGLNELADIPDFLKITRRVNGGLNGLADRQALYDKAKLAMGVT